MFKTGEYRVKSYMRSYPEGAPRTSGHSVKLAKRVIAERRAKKNRKRKNTTAPTRRSKRLKSKQ
eukprot:SAG11_NODE_5268_length_1610_cov_6.878226_2_plen_64_part_00